MAILELEEGARKALAELVSTRPTAKQMDNDLEKVQGEDRGVERRAMLAVPAGDDEAAKVALKEKKICEIEYAKIERDKHEAASYAIQLQQEPQEFETKLQLLKMRKGTLAEPRSPPRAPPW